MRPSLSDAPRDSGASFAELLDTYQPPAGQTRLVGTDASHAWLAVYCPDNGWIDLDPTNDTIPGARHITLAWGRDYGDVSPLRGVVLGGDDHTLRVGVSVTPVADANRESL